MNSLSSVFSSTFKFSRSWLLVALVCVAAVAQAGDPARTKRQKHRKPPPKPAPVKPKITVSPSLVTPLIPSSPSGPGTLVGSNNANPTQPLAGFSLSASVPQLGGVGAPAILGLPSTYITGTFDKSAQGGQLLRAWITEDKVTVEVPSGIKRVVVQRTTSKGWKTVATSYINGNTQSFSVAIAEAAKPNELRVVGYRTSKFTATQMANEFDFTWNQNEEIGNTVTRSGSGVLLAGTLALADASTAVNASFTTVNAVASTAVASTSTTTATTATATPVAVESDIWKVIGNRLFFFNQYRGLQVFDLTDPVHPVKLGSLRMAAKGEFFYALDAAGTRLALLTRNDSNDTASGYSAIKILAVSSAGVPTLVTSIPVPGYLGESRLIGSRLYVVETYWREALAGGGFTYRWNNFRIHGFDLTDLSAPVDLGTAEGRGYTPVLEAAGNYLLASTSEWGYFNDRYASSSKLHVVDISGDGKPRLVKVVTPKGRIDDQFKMTVLNDTLVTATLQTGYWSNWQNSQTNNSDGTITFKWSWTLLSSADLGGELRLVRLRVRSAESTSPPSRPGRDFARHSIRRDKALRRHLWRIHGRSTDGELPVDL